LEAAGMQVLTREAGPFVDSLQEVRYVGISFDYRKNEESSD
jgi:hypothetical protein